MHTERFYSFNQYLRKRFGQRVQRISLNAGMSCPNLDGTLSNSGCIFCNNRGFGSLPQERGDLNVQISEGMLMAKRRFGATKFIAYFQSQSNTYATLERLKASYDTIRRWPAIVGLFVATRPDCVNEEITHLLATYTSTHLVWLEYGLQTTHNHLLEKINRNHTYEDFLTAVSLARQHKISVGVHMILGLPQATHSDMLLDAERLSTCGIQGVKFHALHVFKETELFDRYRRGEVKLLKLDEYVSILCDFLERLPPECVVLRLISTARPEYLVAPLWINDRTGTHRAIAAELNRRKTQQGARYAFQVYPRTKSEDSE